MFWGFGPREWRGGLRHCIVVLKVSLQTLVRPQVVSQDREFHRAAHNWPRFGEGLAIGGGSSHSSDSLWRAGRLQSALGHQLMWMASGLSGRVLRSGGRRVMFWRTHDSTFASRARWGVSATRQDRNHKNGEKKERKIRNYNVLIYLTLFTS